MKRDFTICVADDDEDDHWLITTALQEIIPRCKVESYKSCADLLIGLMSKEKCDVKLIILDAIMPRINGLTCLKQIKDNPNLSKIPVYIFSGTDDPEMFKDYSSAGAASCFSKPPIFEDFKLLLERVIKEVLITEENDNL